MDLIAQRQTRDDDTPLRLDSLAAGATPLQHVAWLIDDPVEAVEAKMTELGVPSQLVLIEDGPHAFLGRQDWFDTYVDYAASFFTIHLKDTP